MTLISDVGHTLSLLCCSLLLVLRFVVILPQDAFHAQDVVRVAGTAYLRVSSPVIRCLLRVARLPPPLRPVVNAAVKSIDRRFEEIGPGGLRPDLARVCNPTCGLHGQSAEELAFQSASVPLSMHELLTQGSSASLGMK